MQFRRSPLGITADSARWRAVVYYATENGTVEVDHWLEELNALHSVVEIGPHWDTIERIEVFRVNHCQGPITVEASRKL